MSSDFERILAAVHKWCEGHGIRVEERELPSEKAGEFNGIGVVMNRHYDAEQRVYYLVHAIGSMVLWSLDKHAVQQMFDALREAKEHKETQPERLESAIERYRAFEIESSQLAVRLLAECGHSETIGSYTNFMRADLEAMTLFHRTGRAPVWKTFFQQWNEDVASGRRQVAPFRPKIIPPFQPVQTEKQEIFQR